MALIAGTRPFRMAVTWIIWSQVIYTIPTMATVTTTAHSALDRQPNTLMREPGELVLFGLRVSPGTPSAAGRTSGHAGSPPTGAPFRPSFPRPTARTR